MKRSWLSACLLSLAISSTAFAQIVQTDTSDRPLNRQLILNKFFLQSASAKTDLFNKLQADIPEPDSGKIAITYDMLRSEIAMTYFKTGDDASAMPWVQKIHTNEGKIKIANLWGKWLLTQDEKKNAAKVAAMFLPLVDSASRVYKKNVMGLLAYNVLMPVYVQALQALGKNDVIVQHLGTLYEAQHYNFPANAKARAIIKPKDYKLTDNLAYDYGMALGATGNHKEAILVLSRLYLTGEEVSDQIQADIKTETGKMKGGTAYYQHLVDSVRNIDNNKLVAFAQSKKDINGAQLNFASLKGKYVLLDFWGSWCRPCRASHPHLKELYSKYRSKGFEIIGIAMEHAPTPEAMHKAWTDAVQADDLPWLQVLNNEQLAQFDAVKEFGVTAFPTKILLDKKGNIIGRYVGAGGGSEAFGDRLKELLGE